jgi:hypothetical protein
MIKYWIAIIVQIKNNLILREMTNKNFKKETKYFYINYDAQEQN